MGQWELSYYKPQIKGAVIPYMWFFKDYDNPFFIVMYISIIVSSFILLFLKHLLHLLHLLGCIFSFLDFPV